MCVQEKLFSSSLSDHFEVRQESKDVCVRLKNSWGKGQVRAKSTLELSPRSNGLLVFAKFTLPWEFEVNVDALRSRKKINCIHLSIHGPH